MDSEYLSSGEYNTLRILEKALETSIDFNEANFLKRSINQRNLEKLFDTAFTIRKKYFGDSLNCFYPGMSFPAISITGAKCSLNCKHCNAHYLQHMMPATNPDQLYDVCLNLEKKGAVGCLISGGNTPHGALPFAEDFIEAIKKIKMNTNLILNVHTGLIDFEIAKGLVDARVDVASIDIVGSDETIREIYGLKKTIKDYEKALDNHVKAGFKIIVPHVCVGLHYGEIKGELKALEMISKISPETIVFIVIIPVKGTEMENVLPPPPLEVAKLIAIAKLIFPKTSLALGCMRPSREYRNDLDFLALKAGIDRIGLIRKRVRFEAEKRLGLKIREYISCCSVDPKIL